MRIIKRDNLLKWCRAQGIFNSVDIREWGIHNYYISADRSVRHFAEDNLIRRIPDAEAKLRGLTKDNNAKIAWYEV